MRLTSVILAILLLTATADRSFRHGGNDNNNNGDKNGDNNDRSGGNSSKQEDNSDRHEDSSNKQSTENTKNHNHSADNSNTKSSDKNTASNTNTASSSSNTQSSSTTSGSSTTSPQSSADDSYIQKCLDNHNEERNSLGLGSVTWNSDLADASLVWAKHLASVGSLSHSSGRVHTGENVSSTTHRDGTDNTVHLIGLWLDERKYFKNGKYPNISNSGNVHDVGHYSQMIWAATTEIGCATATGSGKDFMCCQYKTSGNVQGQKVY